MKTIYIFAMKPIIFGLIAFWGLFLMQCSHENDNNKHSIMQNESSGFTKITGYIHNRDIYPETKEVIVNVAHISGQDRMTQIKSPIKKDGTFYFEIDLARPQDVTIEPYLDFLYLIPGDSLHIELNFKNFSYIRLSGGKSAAINQDFFRYFDATGYRTTQYNYRGVGTDCEMNCSWAEIRKKMDKERSEYRERRQAFLRKNSVCDEVKYMTEAMIELDYYRRLVSIIMNREMMYGQETMPEDILMNEVNEAAVKYFNTDLYSFTHFRFTSAYMGAAKRLTKQDSDENLANWAKQVAITDTIRDFIMTISAGYALLSKDLEKFEKYSAHVTNEYLLDRLMQTYRVTLANMVNPENISANILGKPTDFSNIGSLDNNILSKIIAPNVGKVQVINISTTWCAPCMEALRQTNTLMNDYVGKDVCNSIISVSPDNDETRERYRKIGIDDEAIHYMPNEDAAFLMKTFAPIAFPYGILVNRKGVIVDYGPHVVPGIKLRDKINLLLEQDHLIK